MIKKFTTSVFFLFSFLSFSQTQIKVLDLENQKPIPYAKIILKDKDYYKNTEENGEANLEKNEEISEIQSFGYENLIVKNSQTSYFLKPKFINIQEVEISKPKFAQTYTIGNVKENNFGFMSGLRTWEVINFFANKNKTEKTYIKKIKILTEVKKTKQEAIFNLVFYENVEGHTGAEKLKNVVVTCKKGKNVTEIDFSKNPITFPKEGLFIGVEWIMNEQNHYLDKATILHTDGTKEKNKIVDRVNPFFYGYKSSSSDSFGRNSEISQNGKRWEYKFANSHNLSMEIEITN